MQVWRDGDRVLLSLTPHEAAALCRANPSKGVRFDQHGADRISTQDANRVRTNIAKAIRRTGILAKVDTTD